MNTRKLDPDLVKDIASNLGWEKGEDIEPYLEEITRMTPEQALKCFAEWTLGDRGWATIFIRHIDQLREASK
jgi:hypothetical protein